MAANVVQIACGDPYHASWGEGDDMPAAALAAGFDLTRSILGLPGEDYTTPQTIQQARGFGDPATRPERLERFAWALDRTLALGLADIMLHAAFILEPGDPDRRPFLDTLDLDFLGADAVFVAGGVLGALFIVLAARLTYLASTRRPIGT